MMAGAKRAIWLKAGLWPAVFVAIAPIVVALFHLAPMAANVAAYGDQPGHHQSYQRQHDASGTDEIAALLDTALAEGCGSPAEPRNSPAHQAPIHCPLCLWLQGFHALPSPDFAVPRQPQDHAIAFSQRETVLRLAAFRATAQPRAPPVSPAA